LYAVVIRGKDEGDLNFPYPITLTTFHLVYAAVATRLMRKFTPLLDGLDNVEITWQRWYSNVSSPFHFRPDRSRTGRLAFIS
jgi:hypothetical protein